MEPPPEAPLPGASRDPQFCIPELRHSLGKSNMNTFCKALLFVALLLVVLLFPSRAPEFFGQGNFNDVWEILHLLFIGIVVSYGLFCRRPDRVVDRGRIGNGDFDAYLSGISQLSSFFEGGVDNVCGSDGHDVMPVYGNVAYAVSNVCNGNGENVSQTWCSQYLKDESFVVVSNGKYSVGGDSDFKPLNLPVRSLKSGTIENGEVELNSGYDFWLEGGSMSNDDVNVVKIRGVVPVNLDRFDEVAGTESIPLRSKSGRMGTREERNDKRMNAQCRPHSVGEIGLEHIKSGSFLCPSSPELVSPHVELMESRKVSPVSCSKVALINSDASFGGGKMRIPSSGNCGVERVAPPDGDASFRGRKMQLPTAGNHGEEKVASPNVNASFRGRKMRPPTAGNHGEEKVASPNGDASFRGRKMRPPTAGNHGEEKVASPNGDASFTGRKMRPPTAGNHGEEKVASPNGDASIRGRKMRPPTAGSRGEEKVASPNGDASFRGGKMQPTTAGNRGEEKIASPSGDASFRAGKMRHPTAGNCGEEKVAPPNGDPLLMGGKMRLPTASDCVEEKVASPNGDAPFRDGTTRPPTAGNCGEEKVAPPNGDASFSGGKTQPPTAGNCGEEKVAPPNSDPLFMGGKMRPSTGGNCGEEKVTSPNGDALFMGGKIQPPATGNLGEDKVAPLNGDASFRGGKTWPPTTDNHGEDDKLGKGKLAVELLESDTRSSLLVNVLSKAKSVRTIKPRRYNFNDKEQNSVHIDRKPGRSFRKYESDSMVKRGSEEEPENHYVNHQNHEFDSILSMPNPKPLLDEFSGGGKEGIDDCSGSESEEEMEKLDNSSDEENAKTYLKIDSELEGSEVDRKAGEFIAKFREQIRLQKASSVEG